MSTFTAGPWCVRDIPSKERYVGPSSDGGAPSVAIIPARASRSDAEQAANAKLIASAPDLLAALRDAISIFKFGDDDHTVIAPKWVARAEAAIAKATGEPT